MKDTSRRYPGMRRHAAGFALCASIFGLLHTCDPEKSFTECPAVTFRTPALIFLCVVALAGCNSEPEDTRPGQPVAHRRAAFKEIIKAFEPMGVMMRTDSYDAAKLKKLAAQLMARREVPWEYFKVDTLYPPSHAREEVWTEADKFEEKRKAFFEATDTLARVVETPDEATARSAYKDVEASCESCHKTFKRR